MSPTEIRYEGMSWQGGLGSARRERRYGALPAEAASPEGLIAVTDRRLAAAKTGGRGRAVTV
jgi:hypothetical protein